MLADDPHWADWPIDQLDLCSRQGALVINPIILAELSPRFERATDLEAALSLLPLKRRPRPWTRPSWPARRSRSTARPPAPGAHPCPTSTLVRMRWWQGRAFADARCCALRQLLSAADAGQPLLKLMPHER